MGFGARPLRLWGGLLAAGVLAVVLLMFLPFLLDPRCAALLVRSGRSPTLPQERGRMGHPQCWRY
jgi:hypothetical protein